MKTKIGTPQARQVTQSKSKPDKQRPVHEVKLPYKGGFLQAAIWREWLDEETYRFVASLGHARKDASGKWIYGRSFTSDQLYELYHVIGAAHSFMTADVVLDDEKEAL